MEQERSVPLSRFVDRIAALYDQARSESEMVAAAKILVGELVAVDDWLPSAYAVSNPTRYQQYLLYRDPMSRFCVVSFVWGPGQSTPVHDHTVWGVIGVLRGAEVSEGFEVGDRLRSLGPARRLCPGEVEAVSPTIGDIHRVANAFDDRTSVSIHLYGADIGAVQRSTFDLSGAKRAFVSGYADAPPMQGAGDETRS